MSVAEANDDFATLQELNRNYVRSVLESDVRWFEANLAQDFITRMSGSCGRGAGSAFRPTSAAAEAPSPNEMGL